MRPIANYVITIAPDWSNSVICTHVCTFISGVVANHRSGSQVDCLALIGACFKREFRFLNLKPGKGAGTRAWNGVVMPRLEKLQLHTCELHTEQEHSPNICCYWLHVRWRDMREEEEEGRKRGREGRREKEGEGRERGGEGRERGEG